MSKRVELPLVSPMYSTYHHQGSATAIIKDNMSMRNLYLNQNMNLKCSKKFLKGYTSPQIIIVDAGCLDNPYFDTRWISSRFTKGYINPIIRELIDNGYYVVFFEVDDYYIEGKTWYKERHFPHDGLICGYDQNDKTYCIYAYDSNWIYRKFWISQKDFNAGRVAMRKKGVYSRICALKVGKEQIDFSPKIALKNIKEYLDSNLEKYPFDSEEDAYGMIVHKYIAEYVYKLYKGDIPYECMDKRVFRLIWEHKKIMLERIEKIEQCLHLSGQVSEKYQGLIAETDLIRMLYASHHMKRRDSVLPIIKNKLLKIMECEKELLTLLVEEAEGELKNETLEIS